MPRVMQQRGVRLGWGGGCTAWAPSIIDTIRREVIRTLTAWSRGLHAATTNFLRHLARSSFTAKAPLVLFTGFFDAIGRPFNTDTCPYRRWKAFLPCNRSALLFFFFPFFSESGKNLVRFVLNIFINGRVFKW